MKLGFFTMPMHPPGRNYTETLKEDRAAVLLCMACRRLTIVPPRARRQVLGTGEKRAA